MTDSPPTCYVLSWVVFAPGNHKGRLYVEADCARLVANFRRLRGHLTPVAKIGHDAQQRLSASLGFPSLGTVADARLSPDGEVVLDLVGVPAEVGAEISAGRLNSGSVELLPRLADPDDPAESIHGPILSAVAFLGEEQPAVKGFPAPRATFADGRPVPPSASAAGWLSAMAAVARQFAAQSAPRPAPAPVRVGGRAYAAVTVPFAEFSPDPRKKTMAVGIPSAKTVPLANSLKYTDKAGGVTIDPKALAAELKAIGLDDDRVAAVLAKLGISLTGADPKEQALADRAAEEAEEKKLAFSAGAAPALNAGGAALVAALRYTNPRVAAVFGVR